VVARRPTGVFPTGIMVKGRSKSGIGGTAKLDRSDGLASTRISGGGGTVAPVAGTEEEVLAALRRGDEEAFAALVAKYNAMLMRLAMMYVRDRSVAEDVVQETWIGFLESLNRFEGRASIKTWIFRILINTAKKRLRGDRRSIPFSSLGPEAFEQAEPAVDPERFLGPEHSRWPHHWRSTPADWGGMPESRLVSNETIGMVESAIESLAPAQREVITLRDIEGWTSDEVCNVLGITDTNQRVLLHRARSKVRRELEKYFDDEKSA
jgi:RNA polymerase sigma-70 factor (ECF subfamily)